MTNSTTSDKLELTLVNSLIKLITKNYKMEGNVMKRVGLLLLVLMLMVNAVGCSQTTSKGESESDGIKIGMTVQSLENPIFSESCDSLKKLVEAEGGTMTYVSSDMMPNKQIEQIENFVSSGVDVIVLHPVDAAAVEEPLKKAREEGIIVFSWDDNLENADIAWLIDNYELGKLIGQEASQWINDNHGGECEVAVLDYPTIPILLERGNGIVDAIKENAPNAKIVAQQPAINAQEGITVMETIFQAHPDVQVVACIGGGGATGANEAIKSSDKLTDKVGVFAADATGPELAAMKAGESNRMSVLITGDHEAIAARIYELITKKLAGAQLDKEQYRKLIPVNSDNLDQYYAE